MIVQKVVLRNKRHFAGEPLRYLPFTAASLPEYSMIDYVLAAKSSSLSISVALARQLMALAGQTTQCPL